MERVCCVYTLLDPRTKVVRYVGSTLVRPLSRYAQHIYQWKRSNDPMTHVNNWIKSLYLQDLKPVLNIEEDNIPESLLDSKETIYILKYRKLTDSLCNHVLGRGGTSGFKMSEESKNKRLNTLITSKAWAKNILDIVR